MTGFSMMLLAAVQLFGVTGADLRVRAYFDVNNVTVGDPMVLTVDFLGEADFAALHPPELSKAVSEKDWKLDDASAKTDTEKRTVGNFFSQRQVTVSRSITYRVRPLREGVLWFPEIEFEYADAAGARRVARTASVPVHVRPGQQVIVEGLQETDGQTLPAPPDLIRDPGWCGGDLSACGPDAEWNWRRALAAPSADAFRPFDLPAARMNEAGEAIRAGDWKRALDLYTRLEWRIGQIPELERGLVAAIALRYHNPMAELPVWRQVGRPVLRHALWGRVGLVVGAVVAVALVLFFLSRLIRALAVMLLTTALLPAAAQAQGQDPFAMMEEMHQRMEQRMQQMHQQMSFSFGGAGGNLMFSNDVQQPTVTVSVRPDAEPLQVGKAFNFLVDVERPKSCTLEGLRLQFLEGYGLKTVGEIEVLQSDEAAAGNPSNVVMRLRVPARFDVPYRGGFSLALSGQAAVRQRVRGSSFSFSSSFSSRTPSIRLEVQPLPSAGQPPDFSGLVAANVALQLTPDLTEVGTNDVVTLTGVLTYDGYLPSDWMLPGMAYEWERGRLRSGKGDAVVWKGYFVADGADRLPEVSVCYYDPMRQTYRRVKAGGEHVNYR